MTYEATGFSKYTEEDVWSQGCIPNSGISFSDDMTKFRSDTVDGLIDQLMAFTGVNSTESVLRDSCDEEGRLDIQVLETADGYAASEYDIQKWKDGAKRLWLCDYIFQIEQVDRKPVKLLAEA